MCERQQPQPDQISATMKRAIFGVLFVAAVVVSVLLFARWRHEMIRANDWQQSAERHAREDNQCQTKLSAQMWKVRELTRERDRLRAELNRATEALGIEENSESVELSVFREKLLEVDSRLAQAKEERNCAETEFLKVLDENGRLRALIEAKDDALQRYACEINCLREELTRAQSCVKCHESHAGGPRPKEKKHRRHCP